MRHALAVAFMLLLAPPLAARETGSAPPAATIDPQALTAFLKRAIEPGAGLDSGAVAALRQLRDPRLRPLFAHLALNGPESLRAAAALGLADLDEPPRLDPLVVAGLPPTAMEEALRRGEREGRLTPDLLATLAARLDLSERTAGFLALCSARAGGTPDADLVRRLTASVDLRAIACAAALLSVLNSSESVALAERLLADGSAIAGEARAGLLADLRLLARPESGVLLQALAADARLSGAARTECIETLLGVSPGDAAPIWQGAYFEEASLAPRLRLALAALQASPRTPPEIFETLAQGPNESLLKSIGVAGAAATRGELRADLCATLIVSAHAPTIAWVLDAAAGMPNQDATAVRLAVVALLKGGSRVDWAVMEQAVRAAAALAEESSADFTQTYTEACWAGDESLCQALLLGILHAKAPRALGAIAAQEPPGPEAKALAAIVMARGEATLTQTQLEALDRAAGGSGGISDARRVQAAWLLLRHTGAERAALARMLSDGE